MSRNWSRAVLWGLKLIAGLDYDVRGTPPAHGVLVASKHMSMWDTIALYLLLDDPTVVVKRELLRVPFYGWYIWKAGVIAIDRNSGAHALRRMIDGARTAIAGDRAILIFPGRPSHGAGSGTRLTNPASPRSIRNCAWRACPWRSTPACSGRVPQAS